MRTSRPWLRGGSDLILDRRFTWFGSIPGSRSRILTTTEVRLAMILLERPERARWVKADHRMSAPGLKSQTSRFMRAFAEMGVQKQRNQQPAAGSSRSLAGFPTLQWQGGIEGPRLFSDRDLIRSDPMGRRLGPLYEKKVYHSRSRRQPPHAIVGKPLATRQYLSF